MLFTVEGFWLLGQDVDAVYLGFVFLATVLIYSTHRIIGIKKLAVVSEQGRFQVIKKYRHHLHIYTAISLVGMLWLLPQLSLLVILSLLPLGVVSILYTLPFLGGARLRDLHYIKIVLIAIVWSGLAVLPIILHQGISVPLAFVFMEKICFMVAITIPFDVRDLGIDGGLKTIPQLLGINKAYNLAYLLLGMGWLCLCLALVSGAGIVAGLRIEWLLAVGIIHLLTFALLRVSKGKTSDYYFSGALDGTLILRGIILYGVMLFHY